jgi:flagellar hook-basal body complex protein FliE
MALQAIGAIQALGGLGAATGASPVAATGLDAIGAAGSAGATSGVGQAGSSSFLDSLGQAFGNLNGQLVGADAAMADFAAGGSADLHTVLLQMQEASLGLKLGVQVRDKLLEAYQEIMRMQL